VGTGAIIRVTDKVQPGRSLARFGQYGFPTNHCRPTGAQFWTAWETRCAMNLFGGHRRYGSPVRYRSWCSGLLRLATRCSPLLVFPHRTRSAAGRFGLDLSLGTSNSPAV
jgi:hypothetical protein